MDTLWKIALRNTLRHGRRTVITAVVMMAGIGVFIAYDSILAGMDRLTIDAMVSFSSSYLKVRSPEYVADAMGTPLDHGIGDPAATMAAMKKAAPSLVETTPRTLFVAQASNYSDAEPVMAVAVQADSDAKVFDVAENVHEGSWLGPEARHEVVIAASLATDLGLRLGDFILLSARTVYDNENADEFRIVGIVDKGAALMATASVYLNYADARVFLGEGLPVTEIDASALRSSSLEGELARSATVAKAVRAALPALTVDPVGEFAKDYLALRESKSKGSYILVLMILLIAAVGIVNTILMSVYSRIREIGVLRAYGMTPKDIKKLFTREGLILGVVGSLLGILFGAALDWFLISKGIEAGDMFKGVDLGSIPISGTLRGEFRPSSFAFGAFFGVFVAWFAARIPAKRAAKLQPTDALKFV